MTADAIERNVLRLTADVVAAQVSHNPVPVEMLPELIRAVYEALCNVGLQPPASAPPEPAVPVKKSVFPDYIVCLEDGKQLKMLKRHLMTSYGMTPEDYRLRWGLPDSYPMVAPNYAATRSSLAKKIGLGRKTAKPAPPEVEVQRIPLGASSKRPGRKERAIL